MRYSVDSDDDENFENQTPLKRIQRQLHQGTNTQLTQDQVFQQYMQQPVRHKTADAEQCVTITHEVIDTSSDALLRARKQIEQQMQDIAMQLEQTVLQQVRQLERKRDESMRRRRAAIQRDLDAVKERHDAELAMKRQEQERAKAIEDAKLVAEKQKLEAQLALEAKKLQAQQAEEIARQQAEQAEQEQQLKADQQAAEAQKLADVLPFYGDATMISQFDQQLQLVLKVKQQIKPLINQNKSMADEARRYRMQITLKINQVTNVKRQIVDFHVELKQMFDTAARVSSDILLPFLLDYYAKILIQQAQSEVSANLKKAYPLAYLTLMLATGYPQLLGHVRGRMFKKCIYIVPAYVKRQSGETDDQMRTRMNYNRGADGQGWEQETQMWDRLCGIVALYGAMIQADMRLFNMQSPMNADAAWQYFAGLLNMTPKKITPALLDTMLKVCGQVLVTAYGKQADKLMQFVRDDFLNRCNSSGGEGAKMRVQLQLEHYFKHRQFATVDGSQVEQ